MSTVHMYLSLRYCFCTSSMIVDLSISNNEKMGFESKENTNLYHTYNALLEDCKRLCFGETFSELQPPAGLAAIISIIS